MNAIRKRYVGRPSPAACMDLYLHLQIARGSVLGWRLNQEAEAPIVALLDKQAEQLGGMIADLVSFGKENFPDMEFPDIAPAAEMLAPKGDSQ